jgi:hypothetical protein
VTEDGRTVAFHVLVESNAWPSFGQDSLKRGLATFQRITPQIIAIQFDQVEGVQENAFTSIVSGSPSNNPARPIL